MMHAGLVLELFSIVLCLRTLWGRQIPSGIIDKVFLLCMLTVLELANAFQIRGWHTVVLGIMVFSYCKIKFRDKVLKTIFYIVLMLILLTLLQFIGMVFINLLPFQNNELQVLMINLLVFLMILLLRRCVMLHTIAVCLYERVRSIFVILCFVLFVIGLLIYQSKLLGGISIEYFILAIPLIVFLFYAVLMWMRYQKDAGELQEEVKVQRKMTDSYRNLINTVRIKQHDFVNQVTAILGMRYVYHTYDELVKSQEKYGKTLMAGNKYHKLLGLGENAVAGFLYQKFMMLEEQGIDIELHVHTDAGTLSAFSSVHHLVEVLGILLDNAAEAVAAAGEQKVIGASFQAEAKRYLFTVRNRHAHVSYREMESWFELDQSSKGKQRGIGLYRVRSLCKEFGYSICVDNQVIEDENWIAFTFIIPREGSVS